MKDNIVKPKVDLTIIVHSISCFDWAYEILKHQGFINIDAPKSRLKYWFFGPAIYVCEFAFLPDTNTVQRWIDSFVSREEYERAAKWQKVLEFRKLHGL